MTRLTRTEARTALGRARKPAVGVPAYLRWVNRPLGGRVAVAGAALGASPNGLTAISAVLALGGIGLLMAVPTATAAVVAAALLLAGYVFDSADGQLARIQRRGGPAGEWLDHVVDGGRAPLVHIAVAVHLYRTESALWVVLVAGAFSVIVSAWFLSQLLAEKLLPVPKPGDASGGASRRGVLESLVKQPQDPSTTYLVIAFLGVPAVFVVLYTALFAWHLLIFAGSLRRKYTQLVGAR